MSAPDPIPGVEIRRRRRRDGSVYYVFRVRWKDPVTGKRLVETLYSREDALDFQAHLRLARRRGVLNELDLGRELLVDFDAEWWTRFAKHELAKNTRETYASMWNTHLLPRVGHLQLRQITPGVVDQLKSDLQEDGVGAPTIRKTLSLLQAMLRQAVAWDRLRLNPVKQIAKPKAPRQRAVVALSPAQVESLRDVLLDGFVEHRPNKKGRMREVAHGPDLMSATPVSLFAYAGGRPEDLLALEVRHIGKAILLIEQKNVDGEILVGQKTDRPPRSIELLAPLRQDLAAYLLATGRRTPKALLFPRPDGQPWRETDYRNWRRRVFRPATETAGLEISRPYDLRHAFGSLLIREGRLSLAEIADQMGNSIATLSEVYAHVIADMRGQERVPAETAIFAARAHREKGAL
jgi:integrase